MWWIQAEMAGASRGGTLRGRFKLGQLHKRLARMLRKLLVSRFGIQLAEHTW